MLIAALILNLIVLVPLLLAFGFQPAAIDQIYGPKTDARGILLCLYVAIAVTSAALIFLWLTGSPHAKNWTQTLLAMQVLYKLMTVYVIGLHSPVVATNLAIAVFHSIALMVDQA